MTTIDIAFLSFLGGYLVGGTFMASVMYKKFKPYVVKSKL